MSGLKSAAESRSLRLYLFTVLYFVQGIPSGFFLISLPGWFAQHGLTKAEIRLLSRSRGLVTWSQPSAPCLASRIPYGTPVTEERLAQVERAEQALRSLGITGDLRVRHHDDLARVELEASSIDRWLEPECAGRLADAVRAAGFRRVALDLRGFRSGSLNVLEGIVAA